MKIFQINPIMFEIGPLKPRWYGFMYALSFLLGYLYLKKAKIAKDIDNNQKDTLLLIIILGVLLGGRLGYILFYNLSYYLQNPLKIFALWEGGMSFHGGLIGTTVGLIWFAKKYRHNLFHLGDIITSFAPVALFLGRIGNFINGELYGKIANNYCLYFQTDPQNCRYPSQLLEAFLEGFVLFIIVQIIAKKHTQPGIVTSFFLIFYGIFRIVAELFREPDSQIGYILKYFTEGQILSLLMVIIGTIMLYLLTRKKNDHV